jgi:hypothetical protein
MYSLTLIAIVSVLMATATIWLPLHESSHPDVYEHLHENYPAAAWDLWQLVQPSIH